MITKTDRELLKEDFKKVFATKKELKKTEERLIEVVESVGNVVVKEIRAEIKVYA